MLLIRAGNEHCAHICTYSCICLLIESIECHTQSSCERGILKWGRFFFIFGLEKKNAVFKSCATFSSDTDMASNKLCACVYWCLWLIPLHLPRTHVRDCSVRARMDLTRPAALNTWWRRPTQNTTQHIFVQFAIQENVCWFGPAPLPMCLAGYTCLLECRAHLVIMRKIVLNKIQLLLSGLYSRPA